jgi:chitinase
MLAGLWVGVASAQFPGLPGLNQPPAVSVSVAPQSIPIGGSAVISASAADIDGSIARVVLYDGSTQIAQLTSAPYQYTYSSSTAGTHVITAGQ